MSDIQEVIDKKMKPQLETFVEAFMVYNSHTNLSAIRDKDAIWQKHIIDSLAPLSFMELSGRLLDIGTGGGFPGIPLAIARPELRVTLLDSVGKKIKACDSFIHDLQLKNAVAHQARAESLHRDSAWRKSYDIVTSRATAYLPTLLAWAEPFMKKDGQLLVYKTPSQEEMNDGVKMARSLKLKITNLYTYELEGQERQLLQFKRVLAKKPEKR